MSKTLIKKSKFYFYLCPYCFRQNMYKRKYLKGVSKSCSYCGKLFDPSHE